MNIQIDIPDDVLNDNLPNGVPTAEIHLKGQHLSADRFREICLAKGVSPKHQPFVFYDGPDYCCRTPILVAKWYEDNDVIVTFAGPHDTALTQVIGLTI